MEACINSFPDFLGSFGDKRIDKRAGQALRSLTMSRSSRLRQVAADEAQQKSFYRLPNNESFTGEGLLKTSA